MDENVYAKLRFGSENVENEAKWSQACEEEMQKFLSEEFRSMLSCHVGVAGVGDERSECFLKSNVKLGDAFVEFHGHWIAKGVDSPAEPASLATFIPRRFKITNELHFVSSRPQIFDFVAPSATLEEANVWLYHDEDEKDGHFVLKSEFTKDTSTGEKVKWFVLNMLIDEEKLKARKLFRLETQFRSQCGSAVKELVKAVVTKFGKQGFLETKLGDDTFATTLRDMKKHMVQNKDSLDPTSIGMMRLPYFKRTGTVEVDNLMEDEKWKAGCLEVVEQVKIWGKQELGEDWELVVDGEYGPHGLLKSTEYPQLWHLDGLLPYISGLVLDCHKHIYIVIHNMSYLNYYISFFFISSLNDYIYVLHYYFACSCCSAQRQSVQDPLSTGITRHRRVGIQHDQVAKE
jgi:hypothetical protein